MLKYFQKFSEKKKIYAEVDVKERIATVLCTTLVIDAISKEEKGTQARKWHGSNEHFLIVLSPKIFRNFFTISLINS